MHAHPLIHKELSRQRELDLRGAGVARQRPPSQAPKLGPIVRAATAGDARAWEALVKRFTPTLRGVVRGYRLSAADVDDVSQSAWASAFAHIDSLRDPEAFGSWLIVMARREALRTIERRGREVLVDDADRVEQSHDPAPDTSLVAAERHAAVDAAVGRLPERQRKLLRVLLGHSEMSYGDLSRILEMPVGSIGPTRERALAVLRRDRRLSSLVSSSEPST
jgi:RNA polymerase sigma factor (sigma-70 family)